MPVAIVGSDGTIQVVGKFLGLPPQHTVAYCSRAEHRQKALHRR